MTDYMYMKAICGKSPKLTMEIFEYPPPAQMCRTTFKLTSFLS